MEMISLEEAAEILRRPRATVARLVELGELPSTEGSIPVRALAEYVGRSFKLSRRPKGFGKRTKKDRLADASL